MSVGDVEEMDVGTAYGMQARSYNRDLVEVGPGTPMGELMRRYWQPVGVSDELTSDVPRKVRILGENLILFRDKNGNPGLVHENCCHRGTSLFYGRIEDDGIRCCYHGWKFDTKGRCLEQPAEVDGGRNRSKIRQPWYPVEERYGVVYAYMGPPDRKPSLPRWAHLENLGDDEYIEITTRNPYGPITGEPNNPLHFNYLQAFENTMDSPHLPWLHYYHSGDQFTGAPLLKVDGNASHVPPYAHIKDLAGSVVAERTELGIKQGVPMEIPGQGKFLACNEALVPNVAVVATLIDLAYFVPADDTSFYILMLFRSKKGEKRADIDVSHLGKQWWDMTDEEHQRSPGDYEAQVSIGQLPAHNHEHLSQGDRAIVLLRRRLAEAVRDVQEGRDPPGFIPFGQDKVMETAAHGMIHYEPA